MRGMFAIVGALACLSASAQPMRTTVVNVLDTGVLNILEDNGFSLAEMLGGAKKTTTAEMYASNQLYRSFADVIGRPLAHDARTDQLPETIPPGSGDIPDMV